MRFAASMSSPQRIRFVDLVVMPRGPHPIPSRTRSLSLSGPMVLRLKARESRSPPGLPNGCSPKPFNTQSHPDAGWSSPVARQAHNLKVTGSNPVPAPKLSKPPSSRSGASSCPPPNSPPHIWPVRHRQLHSPTTLHAVPIRRRPPLGTDQRNRSGFCR